MLAFQPPPIPPHTDNAYRLHRTYRHLSAITLFLWALPHFAIPTIAIYRPPAASVFLLLWTLFALLKPQTILLRMVDPGALRTWLILFFAYCILSSLYGAWNLDALDKLTLQLTDVNVDYLGVTVERLLQIVLMLIAFEVVRYSKYSVHDLMRWWLQGATVAVLLHFLTYVLTDDYLLQRSGTFNEGNLAGLYYLLSIFVALEYRRVEPTRGATLFLIIALLGVVLSRSTVAVLLMASLVSAQFILATRSWDRRILRTILMLIVIPIFGIVMISVWPDFDIVEKLFSDEVNANTFSRIDRLESINVAIKLFTNSPIIGHGLQTYGFLSNDLLEGELRSVYNEGFRRIPNNVYVELASELGLVGIVLFIGFISSLIGQIAHHGKKGRLNWLFGTASILFYWNAFPTYSVIFIWAYFGLILKSIHSTRLSTSRYCLPNSHST